MRKSIVVATAGILLAVPFIGSAQQFPDAAATKTPSVTELVALVSAQTEAIQTLHKRILALEKRVKALEEKSTDPSP